MSPQGSHMGESVGQQGQQVTLPGVGQTHCGNDGRSGEGGNGFGRGKGVGGVSGIMGCDVGSVDGIMGCNVGRVGGSQQSQQAMLPQDGCAQESVGRQRQGATLPRGATLLFVGGTSCGIGISHGAGCSIGGFGIA
jgi:hypothetical protein